MERTLISVNSAYERCFEMPRVNSAQSAVRAAIVQQVINEAKENLGRDYSDCPGIGETESALSDLAKTSPVTTRSVCAFSTHLSTAND